MAGASSPSAFVRELALRQLHDYRAKTPGMYFGEEHPPLGLDQAYAVQAEVARLRLAAGDAVAGFKIGCIGPRVVEQFGMSGPIRGILYRSELRETDARLSLAEFPSLAIEAETAIRIGDAGAIAEIFPVIELHHLVFRGARKTLPELVANNGLHAGVVLPRRQARSPSGDAASALSLFIDDVVLEKGGLWGLRGGAEAARDWLASHLAEHGMTLEPGHLVLSGTPLGLHRVHPGQRIRVEAGSLGTAEISVTA